MKRFGHLRAGILLTIIIVVCTGPLYAKAPYASYTYDYFQNVVPAPQAYLPKSIIDGDSLGVGSFRAPRDVFVSDQGFIYILDTGNNRVVRIGSDFANPVVIDGFDNEGVRDSFANPRGIFVNANGDLFVADTDKERIVVLDAQGELVRIIDGQSLLAAGSQVKFRPVKVAVDPVQRVFVLVENVFDGILEFSLDGRFRGFFGAPRVSVSIVEYFWYRISTPQQRAQMALFLPTEFSSIDVGPDGLIYGTVLGDAGQQQAIRLLSVSGMDILRREGVIPPMGDFGPGFYRSPSRLIDVVGGENEMYSVLDATRGRVFTYDGSGNLLYVFGAIGDQLGTFRSPRAIEAFGDLILVLDEGLNRITVFEPTRYATYIHSALDHYYSGRYDEAMESWLNVARINPNYDLAYSHIGRVYLQKFDYDAAMRNFHLGQDRLGYSKAFQGRRVEVMKDNFGFVVSGIILTVVLFAAASRLGLFRAFRKRYTFSDNSYLERKPLSDREIAEMYKVGLEEKLTLNRLTKNLTYAVHVAFHPFEGFWDIKYERRGSTAAATIILGLVVVSFIFNRQYAPFIFNTRDVSRINLIVEAVSVILPFMLWVGVNWAFTTLMDGKGMLKDIYIFSAYALTPIVLLYIPATLISYGLTYQEGTFYTLILAIALIWSAMLLIIGTMVTHHYDVPKTILTVIVNIVGMGTAIFLGMVFLNVVDLMIRFVVTVYTELRFRA
ncbi:MAG: YIP1 family protein [Limnochordia bacterium]